jgi:transcriptional antiterminator RfaH
MSEIIPAQPPVLLPSPSECPHPWQVVHTRPRCEKKVADYCLQESVHYCLPLYTSVKRYQGKVARFEKPLFPGYVFLRPEPARRYKIEQNRYVASLLTPPDQGEFEAQLQDILRALESRVEMRLAPIIREGIRVRITSGPLRGLDGWVVQRKGPVEVQLRLDFIGQAACVALPADALEPV